MQHPTKVTKKPNKHKRKLLLWLLAAALVLATALVLLLPTIKSWFPSQRYPDPTIQLHYQVLETTEPSQLSTITVTHAAGDSYTLEYKNGALLLQSGGELLDINDSTADELLTAATTIAIQDTVTENVAEVADHLTDMGLDPVQSQVEVRYTDGKLVTLSIGIQVPETTYYYYRWSGDDGVYMCDVGIGEVFALTVNRLLPVSQPTLTRTLIDRVRLKNANGITEMSFSSDSAGYLSGMLHAPAAYPMSSDSVSTVLSALENFRLGTLEGEVTAENRSRYGLDDPLCVLEVHQRAGAYSVVNDDGQLIAETQEEQQLRFTFGRVEGDYFYTCEYEGSVYLVSRFLVENLVNGNGASWYTLNPADLGGEKLSAITVQTGTGSLDIRISRTERVLPNNQLETDEEGNVIYDTVVTLNGEEISEDTVNALIERLSAMTVAGDVPAEWSYGSALPRWQLTLTTAGGTVRTISAYAMDAFSDALLVDGVMMHYVYVEALASALSDLMPGE